MKVLNIGHAGFRVKDMEKSLQFYCDGLGFKRAFTLYSQGEDPKPWFEYLAFGENQFVELFYCYDEKKEHPNLKEYYSIHHIALIVDNIKEAYEELKEKGIVMKGDPRLGPDQTWQLWIVDPDGNEIELMEYTEESFQLVKNK